MLIISFVSGLILGGIVSLVILCCVQINRINKYEIELEKLRKQLNKGNETEWHQSSE